MLWAWERPDDLSALAGDRDGVARLIATVVLRNGAFEWRPQLNPHRLPAGVRPLRAVRFDSDGVPLRAASRTHLLDLLVLGAEGAPELQLDHDARRSERDAYLELLESLRARLPATTRLSVTALASWCLGDRWLEGEAIDRAVPMLFRMGRDAGRVRALLDGGGDFDEPLCRSAYGLSTDEPWPRLHAGRTLFIFHPATWDAAAVRDALERSP